MAQRYLNLGCGNDYRESTAEVEWVNADNGKCRKDKYLNIEWNNWAFPDNHFDGIVAIQVLEHGPRYRFVDMIREMYRITKDGGTWEIAVPYGLSDNFVTDPTHKMHFSTRTFDYFINGTPLRENGLIYGWEDIVLEHIDHPYIDGNQSVIFKLRINKHEREEHRDTVPPAVDEGSANS